MAQCPFCAAQLSVSGRIPLKEECPKCTRDLHCCRACKHYDPALNNSCRETQAEWIADKDRPNFCDFFYLAERPVKLKGKEDLTAKWDQLFKKKP